MISALKLVSVSAVVLFGSLSVACSSAPAGDAGPASEDALSRARFTHKDHAADSDLQALLRAGRALDNAYVGLYRFNQATEESHSGAAREKRIKEVMHRYMCSFFDEEISIGHETRASVVLNDVNMSDNATDQDDKVANFTAALGRVLDNSDLDVQSGSASGNNTMGEVMGVYDKAHDEILYFGFTNCGSDD